MCIYVESSLTCSKQNFRPFLVKKAGVYSTTGAMRCIFGTLWGMLLGYVVKFSGILLFSSLAAGHVLVFLFGPCHSMWFSSFFLTVTFSLLCLAPCHSLSFSFFSWRSRFLCNVWLVSFYVLLLSSPLVFLAVAFSSSCLFHVILCHSSLFLLAVTFSFFLFGPCHSMSFSSVSLGGHVPFFFLVLLENMISNCWFWPRWWQLSFAQPIKEAGLGFRIPFRSYIDPIWMDIWNIWMSPAGFHDMLGKLSWPMLWLPIIINHCLTFLWFCDPNHISFGFFPHRNKLCYSVHFRTFAKESSVMIWLTPWFFGPNMLHPNISNIHPDRINITFRQSESNDGSVSRVRPYMLLW